MSTQHAKDTRVNTAFSGIGNLWIFTQGQIIPLGASVIFGVGTAVVCKLSFFHMVFLMMGPFAGWVAVVGNDSRRFFAKGKRVPQWKLRRAQHYRTFSKPRRGGILR